MTSLQLYFINVAIELAETILLFSSVTFIIFGIIWLALTIIEIEISKDNKPTDEFIKFKKLSLKIFTYSLVVGVLLAFIPDRITATAIYILPKIINSQSLKDLPGDIHQLILKEVKSGS